MNKDKSILDIKYKGFWLIYSFLCFCATIFFIGLNVGYYTNIGFCLTILMSICMMIGMAYVDSESNKLRILELEKRIETIKSKNRIK